MKTDEEKGKVSRFGKTVVWVVCAALMVGLLAAAGMAFAADPVGSDAAGAVPKADKAAPPEVVDKSNVAWDNHVQLLQLRHECASLVDQIRHRVQELRAAGVVIPGETRQAIKNAKDAIRASQQALRETVPQLQAETSALHEDRQAKNWAGVLGHLDNIIAIQQTRLSEAGHILAQLQDILQLLNAIGG